MSRRSGIGILLLGAAALAACDKQSPPAEQAASNAGPPMADEMPDTAAPAPSAATNQVDRSHRGEAALGAPFTAPDGARVTLARFAGTPVLLNLWATWCAPCVAEMPTLDAVAGRLTGKMTVLTVSQDLEGEKLVAPFFAKAHFKQLKPYLDDKAALSIGYSANLPTTILFDAKGRELWRVSGGVDWAGAEAAELLAEVK